MADRARSLYFKQKFPQDVKHAGALVADQPSAITKWNGEKAAMESLGYKVVYDQQFDITQTDFTQNVVAMRQDGIKILFLEQMPENYAAAVVKALNQQDYHPQVVFGASTYSEQLVPDSGGASAIDGAYMEMVNSLFLGEDANVLPAAKTFQTWVQKADPGSTPTSTRCSAGCRASCSPRPSRRPGPIPPGARCSSS